MIFVLCIVFGFGFAGNLAVKMKNGGMGGFKVVLCLISDLGSVVMFVLDLVSFRGLVMEFILMELLFVVECGLIYLENLSKFVILSFF